MSTISPSSYHPVCRTPHAARKSAAAATAASSVNRRGLVTSVEDREGDEGEELRDVEVEPVGPRELEADPDGRRECGELQDRLAPRDERDEQSAPDKAHLQHLLHEVEVGDALRVVLPPTPDRERRLAVELEAERALAEHARGVERVGLQQQDEEGGDGSGCEGEPEALR